MSGDSWNMERAGLAVFLILITALLGFVAWPFMAAVIWAMLAAIVFQPLQKRMLGITKGNSNRAALFSLLVITVAVVLPLALVATVVVDEATRLYFALQAQEIDVASYFAAIHEGLPMQARELLAESGYAEFEAVRAKLASIIKDSLEIIASQAVSIGGSALSFALSFGVGLYVAFFLLRDGRKIAQTICSTLPLPSDMPAALCGRIASVVRATIKGSIVVGIVQGALGAITFWIAGVPSAILLGVVMALASLIPAVGTGLIWVPVAAYLFFTGAVWQAAVVVFSGIVIIGMVDNVLRPILVGKDTGIPDWIVLVTTLGGISAFGLSGIVLGPVIAGLFITGWSLSRGVASN